MTDPNPPIRDADSVQDSEVNGSTGSQGSKKLTVPTARRPIRGNKPTYQMSVDQYVQQTLSDPKQRKIINNLATQYIGYQGSSERVIAAWRKAVEASADYEERTGTPMNPYQAMVTFLQVGEPYGGNGSGGGGYYGGGGSAGPTPEQLAQMKRQARAEIRKAANQTGVQLSRKQVSKLAQAQIDKNLSATEIMNRVVRRLEIPEGGDLSGQAGTVQDELTSWAARNGMPITDKQIVDYAKNVLRGKTDLDGIKADLRKTYIAGMYPAWADRINAGEDVADIAAPYTQTAAKMLEVDEIGLDDPIVKSSLQSIGQDGKPRIMPLYEFERKIMEDDRWQRTDNAKSTYANAARSILRSFGLA